MRNLSGPAILGFALVLGLSCGAWAQDQPAAGSPPPGATTQSQPQAPAQNAAPPQNSELPPPPIDAPHAPNPRRQARALAKKLGLTPDQQQAIEPILADRIRRTRSLKADDLLAPQERKVERQEIGRDTVRRINAILTPMQREQYKQLRQEQRARRLERQQQMQMQQQPPAPPSSNQ